MSYSVGDYVLLKPAKEIRYQETKAPFINDTMGRYCGGIYQVEKITNSDPENMQYKLRNAGPRVWSDDMIQQQVYLEAPQVVDDVAQSLGLLEKTLAEIIGKTQADQIYGDIKTDLASRVDTYINETYGPIERKTTFRFEEREVEFEGEVLHARFEDILAFCAVDEPVFLTGAAGTGKNVICKQVAKALNLPFYFTNAVTQEYKLTGFTDAMGKYHETSFYKAFSQGGLFFLDEIDASIPEVLVILNAAIANRYFDFPAPIGYVEANKDFRLIAAGNTFGLGASSEYVGRSQLDAASLDRFAMVCVDYDTEIEKRVTSNNTELIEFCHDFRNAAQKAGIQAICSYRAMSRLAKMEEIFGNEKLDYVVKTCLTKNLEADDLNMIYSNISRKKK